jgi:hypothetical protein
VTAEEFALLERAQRILSRMPIEYSGTKAAHSMLRAVETDAATAKQILLSAGVFDMAAVLVSAAITFRSTGHFANAECMDLLASVFRSWDRRVKPRAPWRKSGG